MKRYINPFYSRFHAKKSYISAKDLPTLKITKMCSILNMMLFLKKKDVDPTFFHILRMINSFLKRRQISKYKLYCHLCILYTMAVIVAVAY